MNQVFVDLNVAKSEVDNKIFGHFMEHAFGNIYGGIYEPGHPQSDARGFRMDALESLKKVAPPIVRYPGGNFVSNYHWEDGIGPKSERKRRFEYAWITEESNQFGTADFVEFCREIGAEPLICVNMGTGTIEEAMHWVEYCNSTGDTYYANLRRSHGYEEPFNVKYWGLGNECYGSWQMNNHTPESYSALAFQFAKAMKWADPTIRLVACGYEQQSEWGYAEGKQLWQFVDYISAHHYSCGWGPFKPENYLQTMCISEYMEKLNKMAYYAFQAGANSLTPVKVAWDEWNMFGWRMEDEAQDEKYDLQDALVTATVLNMFIRNADTIGMANYSTFVNISGALSVTAEGVLERAQFPVFQLLRHNTGKTLYESKVKGETFSVDLPLGGGRHQLGSSQINIPLRELTSAHESCYIDAAVTADEDGTVYVSIVNKHPEEDQEVAIYFSQYGKQVASLEGFTVYHEDLKAANTRENPDTVQIQALPVPETTDNICTLQLKKHSVNLLKFRTCFD